MDGEGMDIDGQAGEDDEEEAQLAWARVIRLSDWQQSAGHYTPPHTFFLSFSLSLSLYLSLSLSL